MPPSERYRDRHFLWPSIRAQEALGCDWQPGGPGVSKRSPGGCLLPLLTLFQDDWYLKSARVVGKVQRIILVFVFRKYITATCSYIYYFTNMYVCIYRFRERYTYDVKGDFVL